MGTYETMNVRTIRVSPSQGPFSAGQLGPRRPQQHGTAPLRLDEDGRRNPGQVGRPMRAKRPDSWRHDLCDELVIHPTRNAVHKERIWHPNPKRRHRHDWPMGPDHIRDGLVIASRASRRLGSTRQPNSHVKTRRVLELHREPPTCPVSLILPSTSCGYPSRCDQSPS